MYTLAFPLGALNIHLTWTGLQIELGRKLRNIDE